MKKTTLTLLVATLLTGNVLATDTQLQNPTKTDPATPIQHGPNFVDLDGDGFNDNAPDFDQDGIPNGMDSDWSRQRDGKGRGQRDSSGNNYRRGNRYGDDATGQMLRQRVRDRNCSPRGGRGN